jgi:acetyltransferase-like isoleucine patch superfamily enzyme
MSPIRWLAGLTFWISNSITTRHFFRKKMDVFERLRVASMRGLGARIGSRTAIRKGAFVNDFRRLIIGERTTIGPFCRMFLFEDLVIGNDVEIGSGLTVHTSEHITDDPNKPLGKQGTRRATVKIASDTYIGSNVTILCGAVIESRVIVGAGSVVRGTLKSGFIYAGVPAKQIREISKIP